MQDYSLNAELKDFFKKCQIDFRACPHKIKAKDFHRKFNFYLCECRDHCPKDANLSEPKCALDIANTGEKTALGWLAKEAIEHIGYGMRSVEWRVVWMNNISWVVNVEGEERKKTHDLRRITNRCRILPFEFPYATKFKEKIHQRASAQQDCQLERFFALLDKDVFPIEIPVRPESVGGTLEHKIENWRFPEERLMQEELLVRAGLTDKSIQRNKYCEQEVQYQFHHDGSEYFVKGHPDAILKIADGDGKLEGICILDFKHAQYSSSEKPGYKMQMLTYALAVTQMFNLKPEYFLLISQRSPFGERPDSWRKTQCLMTKIKNDPNNDMIKGLQAGIAIYAKLQYSAITDRKNATFCRQRYESQSKDGCFTRGRDYDKPCYQKELCDFLLAESEAKKMTILELLKKNSWLPKHSAYQ